MRSRPLAALLGLTLFVGAAASAQAATFSATGPVSVTVSGADTATLGAAYPVTIVATNTAPTPFDFPGAGQLRDPIWCAAAGCHCQLHWRRVWSRWRRQQRRVGGLSVDVARSGRERKADLYARPANARRARCIGRRF
jgi:hypothetical protein